jgi:hypothetical protein
MSTFLHDLPEYLLFVGVMVFTWTFWYLVMSRTGSF